MTWPGLLSERNGRSDKSIGETIAPFVHWTNAGQRTRSERGIIADQDSAEGYGVRPVYPVLSNNMYYVNLLTGEGILNPLRS